MFYSITFATLQFSINCHVGYQRTKPSPSGEVKPLSGMGTIHQTVEKNINHFDFFTSPGSAGSPAERVAALKEIVTRV